MTTHRDHRLTALILGAAALAAVSIARTWDGPPADSLIFWAIVCLAGELMWIRLPLGRATLSMASCCQFAALLVLPRGQAMALTAMGGAFVEAAVLRKPARRVLFNASQAALSVGAASWAFAATSGLGSRLQPMLAHGQLLPFALAAAAYFLVNTGAVSLAVSLSEGVTPFAAWRRNFGHGYEILSSGALFSLGVLLATQYSAAGVAGTLLLALPLLLAYAGYRRSSRRPGEERVEAREAEAA